MSAMNYYQYGRLQALVKLGMDAGVVPYVRSEARDSPVFDNKAQLLWKSVDDEPFVTGEESGVGMPSPAKTGSENDGGYGDAMGSYGVGGLDAQQDLPDRNYRNEDAMRQAFETNRLMDQSTMPEAAATQPHGPKMAMSFPKAPGIKMPGAGEALNPRGPNSTRGLTANPLRPPTINSLPKGNTMNSLSGTLPKVPNTSRWAGPAGRSHVGKNALTPPTAAMSGTAGGDSISGVAHAGA